jgi:hypothetical protein
MRGSPLARALIVFALLLCVAPALWKMTTAGVAEAPRAIKASGTTEQELPVELAFTTAPARVSIKHLGKQVWEKAAPETTEELTLRLPWPSEGGELQFAVEWPESAPLSAVRVRLTDPDRGEIERTIWGRGSKTAVLGFP